MARRECWGGAPGQRAPDAARRAGRAHPLEPGQQERRQAVAHAFPARPPGEHVAGEGRGVGDLLGDQLRQQPREAPLLGTPQDGVHVVRNGVDLDYFQARETDPGGAEIGFVGAMDYEPNARGALWFVREVLPRVRERMPQARLTIVGRRPPIPYP